MKTIKVYALALKYYAQQGFIGWEMAKATAEMIVYSGWSNQRGAM